MVNVIEDSVYNLYSTSIQFARKCLKPSTIDVIERSFETLGVKILGIAAATFTARYLVSTLSESPRLPEGEPTMLPPLPYAMLPYVLVPFIAYGAYKVGSKAIKVLKEGFCKSYVNAKTKFFNQEIQKIVASSKKNQRSALVFQPSSDHSGVLMRHIKIANFQESIQNHSASLISANSKSKINEKMESDQEKYDRIIFRGHGDKDGLLLGEEESKVLLTKNSTKTLKWFHDHAKKGCIIVIEGCRAAKGEENIAREISRACPTATVYASQTIVSVNGGVEYDESGIPTFTCLGRDSTRIYRNGELLSPPRDEAFFESVESQCTALESMQ